MADDDDIWNDPEMQAWARSAIDDCAPKIRESFATISLVPIDGEPDIKFAVELGLSLMYDKPIMLIVEPGSRVPAQLVKVAAEIVECRIGDPTAQQRISEALTRMYERFGDETQTSNVQTEGE